MDAMMIYMPIIMSVLGLIYVFIRRSWVLKQDSGDGKMKEISDHIYEGALAFLNAEYRLLSIFVLIVSVVLAGISFVVPTTHILIVVSFIFGAFFSAFAGNIGMKIATKTNVRTTQAAKTSLPEALKYFLCWWYCYGTRRCWSRSFRVNCILYNIFPLLYGRSLVSQ